MDYAPLIAVWPTLADGSIDQKLAELQTRTAVGPRQDVTIAAVEGYLSLRGLLTEIEDWLDTHPTPGLARTAARELLRTIGSQHVTRFEMSNPTIYAMVEGMLHALQQAGLVTDQHVADLLALAETTVPWWQANGYPAPLNENDLALAGLV